MDEASRCDRIALCNEGRILSINTPKGIVSGFDRQLYGIKSKNMFALLERARRSEGVIDCYPFGEKHHLITNEVFDIERFKIQFCDVKDLEIEPIEPTIEDVFIKLMKR
jgi:ABC-type multidrug transport system ATPase subunit